MSTDKPFRKINELVAALAAAEKGLASGTLGSDGLETACTDARELYERLVVLRHKAREAQVGQVAEPAGANVLRTPQPEVAVPEERSVRLDTRPPQDPPASRQTSLIDAIEHTEERATSPKPAVQTGDAVKASSSTLAQKLEKAAVADLGKAISLSHKFWFVAELFNGDRIAYEKSIEAINSLSDLTQAKAFITTEVTAKLKKPADPEALTIFNELVERRFA